MKNQQKKPPLEDDTSDFTCDIIQNILSRLPLKSLLRLKTVCKSWNAMINDSGFAKIHCNQLNISNSQCLYAANFSRQGTYNLINFQAQEFHVQSVVQCPLKNFESVYILCCCEGILLFEHCFQEIREEKYVLWNPFTRNYSTFSFPSDDIIHDHCDPASYGLCFDKYEDDYKLIVVLRGGKYLIYSVKNDSWVERQSEYTGYVDIAGTYADGVVYWIAGREGLCCHAIIYFDPKDNLLKELYKPADLEPDSECFFVRNLSGNLCLCTREREMFRIWLLKESDGRKCWMKLMTADNRSKSWASNLVFLVPSPMYLTSKNEVVFQNLEGTRYAAYCLEKQKFGEVKEFPAYSMMNRSTCLESLNFPATRKEG